MQSVRTDNSTLLHTHTHTHSLRVHVHTKTHTVISQVISQGGVSLFRTVQPMVQGARLSSLQNPPRMAVTTGANDDGSEDNDVSVGTVSHIGEDDGGTYRMGCGLAEAWGCECRFEAEQSTEIHR